MHLADAFIQSDLQYIQFIHFYYFFVSMLQAYYKHIWTAYNIKW